MVVEALAAMAFVIFVLRLLSNTEHIKKIVTASQFNDLGNLMLAFVMLWAYLSFSQFLIIWAGNLKDEIPWYMTARFRRLGSFGGFSDDHALRRAVSAVAPARSETAAAYPFGFDGHDGGTDTDGCLLAGCSRFS